MHKITQIEKALELLDQYDGQLAKTSKTSKIENIKTEMLFVKCYNSIDKKVAQITRSCNIVIAWGFRCF